MVLKANYRLTYTVDGNDRELMVEVELILNEFPLKLRENVYRGIAIVNGQHYDKVDISHSVNALYSAEEIGLKLKGEIKRKCRMDGKIFRFKNEEIYEVKSNSSRKNVKKSHKSG